MNVTYVESEKSKIAIVRTNSIEFNEVGDVLDMMGNAHYNEAGSIIISKDSLPEEFFELKTGIAGEILQKFSNYGMKLAIVGDFGNLTSKSLRDFIYECNVKGSILFVSSEDEAVKRFSN